MANKRGRKPVTKYNNCIPVSVFIPEELYKELKARCALNDITIKEMLYKLNIRGIKKYLGVEYND